MKNVFLLIFLFSQTCGNVTAPLEKIADQIPCDSSSLNGVLIFQVDSADRYQYSFDILNEDQSIYGQVRSTSKQEPYLSKLKDKIRAYYPDYYIIHFDAAIKNDSIFCVKIGNEIKIVKVNKFVKFLSWPDYIVRFYCVTDESNPVRTSPDDSAGSLNINDYNELSFRCLEVNGDWVQVTCFSDCEGCPANNSSITGWIRWKKGGVLLIKQRYSC